MFGSEAFAPSSACPFDEDALINEAWRAVDSLPSGTCKEKAKK